MSNIQRNSWPRVLLLGHRSALGASVRLRLRASGCDLCLLEKGSWPALPARAARAGSLEAAAGDPAAPAALVVISELGLPSGVMGSLRWRCGRGRLRRQAAELARQASRCGVTDLVVVSSALRYRPAADSWLDENAPTDCSPETAAAEAAEIAAETFSVLGGHSVILRLGWPYGGDDRLTRRVIGAAAKGWQMFDGPPDVFLPTVEITDAAASILPALSAPAGRYNVTDGHPRTQAELSEALATGAGGALHPLFDLRWGHGSLFGRSRRADGTAFTSVTGWRPAFRDSAHRLAHLSRAAAERRTSPGLRA